MNQKSFFFSVLIFSLMVLPFASVAVPDDCFAAETVPLERVSTFLSETSQADSFGLTVSGNGMLISKPGPVFTEGGDYSGMQLPYLVSTPKSISYPRWAVRQGWEGKLSIALEILPSGKVGRTKVMHSTGHRLLDKVAESAVRSWSFHPAMKNGQSIVTCIQIPIVFQLEKE